MRDPTQFPKNQADCLDYQLGSHVRPGYLPRWLLLALVEHTGNKRKARPGSSLAHSEEEPSGHYASKVPCRSLAHQSACPDEAVLLAGLYVVLPW